MTKVVKVEFANKEKGVKYIVLETKLESGFLFKKEGADERNAFQALHVDPPRICVPDFAEIEVGDELVLCTQHKAMFVVDPEKQFVRQTKDVL